MRGCRGSRSSQRLQLAHVPDSLEPVGVAVVRGLGAHFFPIRFPRSENRRPGTGICHRTRLVVRLPLAAPFRDDPPFAQEDILFCRLGRRKIGIEKGLQIFAAGRLFRRGAHRPKERKPPTCARSRDGLPKTTRPFVTTSKFIAPHQDLDVARHFALWMMAPTTSSKVGPLEEATRTTFWICHAFPQVRRTGQDGAAL